MRVLVVGAGPVGLTLALALHRQGVAFRQVEMAAARSTASKALGLQARTMEAVEPLGMPALFLPASLRPTGLSISLGGTVARIDLSHRVHPRYPSMVMLPQSDSERLLAERMETLGLAQPERQVALVSLDSGTGRVELRHPDGGLETAEFDHVLGCDGAHSAVRKAAGLGFEGGRYSQRFILADGPAVGLEPSRLHAFPGHGGARVFFPLPDGQWRAVAALPDDAPDPPEGDLTPFAIGDVALTGSVWWSRFGVSHRLASAFRQGRVCLMGDAAHIHSPIGGQGMNMGMQDACALALALPRGEPALAEWAEQRRRVAAMVLARTDVATRAVLGESFGLRLLRGLALRLLPLLPPARLRMERGLAGMDYPAFDPA